MKGMQNHVHSNKCGKLQKFDEKIGGVSGLWVVVVNYIIVVNFLLKKENKSFAL